MSQRPTAQLDQVSTLWSRHETYNSGEMCKSLTVLPFPCRYAKTSDEKELKRLTDIRTQIKDKENVFFDMEAYLPKKNGSVILFYFNNSSLTASFISQNYLILYVFISPLDCT